MEVAVDPDDESVAAELRALLAVAGPTVASSADVPRQR